MNKEAAKKPGIPGPGQHAPPPPPPQEELPPKLEPVDKVPSRRTSHLDPMDPK